MLWPNPRVEALVWWSTLSTSEKSFTSEPQIVIKDPLKLQLWLTPLRCLSCLRCPYVPSSLMVECGTTVSSSASILQELGLETVPELFGSSTSLLINIPENQLPVKDGCHANWQGTELVVISSGGRRPGSAPLTFESITTNTGFDPFPFDKWNKPPSVQG